MRSIVEKVKDGQSVFLAGAKDWVKPVNSVQGAKRFISLRISRLRILFGTKLNPLEAKVVS